MRKLILGKHKIAYKRIGSEGKPKLLMIHGFGSNSEYFFPVARLLKKDFDILIPDLPGFGFSDKLKKEKYSIENYALIVRELYQHLEFLPCHVVGHSFGGIVSLFLASEYLEEFNKIIFHSTPWNSKCINLKLTTRAGMLLSKSKGFVSTAGKLKNKLNNELLMNSLKLLNKHYYELNKSDQFILKTIKRLDLEAFVKLKDSILDFDYTERAKCIKANSLILIGKNDDLIYPQKARFLSKLISDSTFKVFQKDDKATHTLFLDFPEKMAEMTKDFLS